jgi:serine/threonine protein kinase
MDLPTALEILGPIEEALTYIHKEAGFAHLDVTPRNILIQEIRTRRGSTEWNPMLADFGLSRVINLAGIAQGGKSLFGEGTPSYWAPEQTDPTKGIPGKHSDIYAVGLIIGVMLTGLRPQEVLGILRGTDDTLPPNLPVAVHRVLKRATEERPENRYANIKGLITAFTRAIESIDVPEPSQKQSLTLFRKQQSSSGGLPTIRAKLPGRVFPRLVSVKQIKKYLNIGAMVILLLLVAGILVLNIPQTHFKDLGGLDLTAYCLSLHYEGVTADLSTCSANIDLKAACNWQYPGSDLDARTTQTSNPNSWNCYTSQGVDIGGISDMPGYCIHKGYLGIPEARPEGNNTDNWVCQQKVDVTIACIWQHDRMDARARTDDEGLWRCYGLF